jgi:hypothetical protein
MALQLKLQRIYSSYTNFIIEDITGAYNATTNPTGWGAPNPTRAGITSATLEISGSATDGTNPYTCTLDVTALVIAGTTSFTVPYNTDGDIIPDGTCDAELTVVSGGVTYTNATDNPLETGNWFNVAATIYQRIARVPEYFRCNNCCAPFIKETVCMDMYLTALMAAAQYDDMAEFIDMLDVLTQMVSYDTTWELNS